jgi:hypothetical protein
MSLSASDSQNYRLWHEFDQPTGQNLIQIKTYACSQFNETLAYRLSLNKTGQAGQSVAQQSGQKQFLSGQPILLASQIISLAPGDHYTLTVSLLKQGEVIAHQVFSYPE